MKPSGGIFEKYPNRGTWGGTFQSSFMTQGELYDIH